MAKFELIALEPSQVRELFPDLVGPVLGGLQVTRRAFVIHQTAGAFSVMIDGAFRACCPTRPRAMAFARKEGK